MVGPLRYLFLSNLFALYVALAAQRGAAQQFTWNQTGGGLYATAANWSPSASAPPNLSTESSLFTGTSTQTVTLQINQTVASHLIRSGDVTFQLDGTTQAMFTGGLVVGDTPGVTGRFTMLNGTMTGDMTVGSSSDSAGFVTIGADAVFDAAANQIAVAPAQGSSGTLTLVDGGQYTGTANVVVASNPTANGTVTVAGSGSSLSTSATLLIGSTGLGRFNVSSGATASGGAVTAGDAAGSSASITVSGAGSRVQHASNLTIGNSGDATLRIEAGGIVAGNAAVRIASTGATSSAVVTGKDSQWNAASLAVGGILGTNGGTGTLLVADGGAVNVSGAMEIRSSAGSAVTIDGGTLDVVGNFTRLGTLNFIDGTLHVTGLFDNGAANTALTIDGVADDDLPTLRLSGASGTLAHTTTVTVGAVHRGALVLDTGRSVNLGSNTLLIGTTATGNGSVTVTGSNTALSMTGVIAVGGNLASGQGVGALAVRQNATVTTGTLTVHPQGTVAIDGGTVNAATYVFSPGAKVNFNGGRVNFTANTTNLTAALADGLLGASHELGAGRTIGGGAGAFTVQTPLTVSGGALTSGTSAPLVNASALTVNAGTVNADTTLTNIAGATLVVSGTGAVGAPAGIFNSGTLLLQNNLVATGGGNLFNNGVVRGSGVIGNVLSNETSGRIQAASGERLEFSAVGGANHGVISVDGGDLTLPASLGNLSDGFITGRSGVIRTGTSGLQAGIANAGAIAFSGGTMDVFGDVTQNVGGRITITGGGTTTFYDDVTIASGASNIQVSAVGGVTSSVVFLGSYNGGTTGGGAAFIEGDHRPGNSPGLVSFGGDLLYGGSATLNVELGGLVRGSQYDAVDAALTATLGGTVNVSLVNSFVPALGNTFEILHAAGGRSGGFALGTLPTLPTGVKWALAYTPTSALLSVVPQFLAADFNENGSVEGADLALWRSGFGVVAAAAHGQGDATADGAVRGEDYLVWQRQFGQSGARAVSSPTTAAVPEPPASVLVAFALAAYGCRDRGRRTMRIFARRGDCP